MVLLANENVTYAVNIAEKEKDRKGPIGKQLNSEEPLGALINMASDQNL